MILLLLSIAFASDVTTLSLRKALDLVVERNPDLQSAALAESMAAIDARRARLDRFSASIGTTAGGQAGFVKPWDQPAQDTSGASWDARADVAVPLYAGGRIRATIEQADAAASIAGLDVALSQRSLLRATYTAYWSIKGYELQIAAAEEGLALTRESLAIIQAKADAGLAAGIDVNRSTVDVYAQEERLVSDRAQLYDAEQELIRLLHLTGEHVVLVDEPGDPASGTAALPSPAGASRPELARLAREADAADAAIRGAQAGALPTVSLSATAGVGNTSSVAEPSTSAFDPANLAPGLDATAGLSVTWNPFDLFQTRDAVAQAKLARKQLSLARESEIDAIEQELRQARSAVIQLRERVPLVDAQESLARDNLRIVSELYAQGSASILDLFDAQAAFRQARIQGASLRVALATAELDLRWVAGADLLAPESTP